MKLKRLSLIIAATIGLSACQLTSQESSTSAFVDLELSNAIQSVIDGSADIMAPSTTLYTTAQFDIAANQLLLAVQSNDIEKANALLYFFRGFSFYGDAKALSEQSIARLDSALLATSKLDAMVTNHRLQEQYAVTVMRFYGKKTFSGLLPPHLKTLITTLANFDVSRVDDKQATFALWESFRAIGILSYYATRYDDEALAAAIKSSNINDVLFNFVKQHGQNEVPLWVNQNALWVLANSWRIADAAHDGDDKNPATKALDGAVSDLISTLDVSDDYKKQLFTYGYLTSTYRGQSECDEEFAGQCHVPNLDDVLPIKHVCSDSLFIRAQNLTKQQLDGSCQRLTSQEDNFHQLFKTGKQPVANDLNTSLRVVIFDEWSQYHAYSPILFDINTDNGGMYIEGTPADPNNQATFFAFKATWFEPEFKVWNLNHEYVHYLTGRFTTYGPFGHYDDSLVWWSEGVAELIAKDKINPKVYKLNHETKVEDKPSLEDIFATSYKDGSERVYSWSYLAARYLADHDAGALVRLKELLKSDFFDGYKTELTAIASQHQTGFSHWLAQQSADFKAPLEKADTTTLPHKINRYAYPRVLTPALATSQVGHQRY